MRKNRKKVASVITALSMTLAACGSNAGTDKPADTQQPADSTQQTADAQQGTDKPTGDGSNAFTIFAGIGVLSADNSEKPVVQQMNEAMGVTINWECISGDTLKEKKIWY